VPLRPTSIFPADFFAFAGLLFYLMDRGVDSAAKERKREKAAIQPPGRRAM